MGIKLPVTAANATEYIFSPEMILQFYYTNLNEKQVY